MPFTFATQRNRGFWLFILVYRRLHIYINHGFRLFWIIYFFACIYKEIRDPGGFEPNFYKHIHRNKGSRLFWTIYFCLHIYNRGFRLFWAVFSLAYTQKFRITENALAHVQKSGVPVVIYKVYDRLHIHRNRGFWLFESFK